MGDTELSSDVSLREREPELNGVGALLDRVEDGRGGLLAFSGPAGLGKSRLLDATVAEAAARGIDVARHQGDQLGRSFAWGGAIALLDDDAGTVTGMLRGDRAGVRPEGVALAVLESLVELVQERAGGEPLLLVIDDAHWLDEPTLRLVRLLLARTAGHRVGVVLAFRPDEPGGPAELLRAIAAHAEAQTFDLANLSASAVGAIVADRLGAETPDDVRRRCLDVTGGNPFYLTELLRSLHGNRTPDLEALEAARPPTVARSVIARLDELGEPARRLAEALAVLGDGIPLRFAAALAGVETTDALVEIDRLIAAGLVVGAANPRYVHPLVKAVVADDIAPGRSAAWHAAAAALHREAGSLPETVATHLLEAPAGAVADAADVLERAAARAVQSGAPKSAVAYLERAIEEPMGTEDRRRVDGALADAAYASASPRCVEYLDRALSEAAPGEPRARIRLALGWALHSGGRPGPAATAFAAGREDVEPGSELDMELEAGQLTAAALARDHVDGVEARLHELPTPTTAAERHLHSEMITLALFEGDTTAQELAARTDGLVDDVMAEEGRPLSWATWNAIGTYSWCDRFSEALARSDVMLERGRRAGSSLTVAMASYARAWPSLWTGRLAQGAEDARRAVDIWSAGAQAYLPGAVYWLICCLLAMGHLEDASAALAGIDPEAWAGTAFAAFTLAGSAQIAVARGELDVGLARWRECGEFMEGAMRKRNPTLLPWRSELAAVAARVGEEELARTESAEDLERAERFAAPRALGVALRSAGLARRDEEGVALLRRSVDVLAPAGVRYEQAISLVDLGAALRRGGQPAKAREPLREGMAIAREIAAAPLADRAFDELTAAGARPRRRVETGDGLAALTASERRVAELAAGGSTNREIAAELYLTVKTVEWHLSRIYEKLAIARRGELAAALAG